MTKGGRRNILELIFTNNHELLTSIHVQPSEITDHEYIRCETSYVLSTVTKERVPDSETNLSAYNYESANWNNIKTALKRINWPEVLSEHKKSEEKLKVILEIVIKIIEENCTTFRNQRGSHSNNIPKDRRVLFRSKRKLNKELQKWITPNRKKQIEEAIGKIDKKLLNSYKEETVVNETRAIENIKSNPKYFFTYAKKKLKTRSRIGPFDIEGEKFTGLMDICVKLVEQYSSAFSQPDPRSKIENPTEFFSVGEDSTDPILDDVDFTRKSIIDAIKEVKNNAAPGTDRFPVVLLKECAEELSEPLHILWRHSLNNGDIAPLLKTAVICPILKPGSPRNHPKSYRPVSLTSHIIKVFERII